MVLAVSDSDVLIHLAKLDLLYLLKDQFAKIYTSEIIYNECVVQGISLQKTDAILLKDFFQSEFIIKKKVNIKDINKIKDKYNIHEGESSIIALAKIFNVDLFLTNEIKVRNIAKSEGFSVSGTLGIILRGFTLGSIEKDHALRILKDIQEKIDEFRFHPKLIEIVLNKLEKM